VLRQFQIQLTKVFNVACDWRLSSRAVFPNQAIHCLSSTGRLGTPHNSFDAMKSLISLNKNDFLFSKAALISTFLLYLHSIATYKDIRRIWRQ
jgi:hypothetical protein